MHSGQFHFKPKRNPKTGVAAERAETPRSVKKAKAEPILPTHERTFSVLSTMITFPVQKLTDAVHLPPGDLSSRFHWACPTAMGLSLH